MKILPVWLMLALLLACTPEKLTENEIRPNPGRRKNLTFEEIQAGFSNPDMLYAPFIFWFWDEPLNADKMAEMARVLGSQGFNPGYAHPRNSMVGTPDLPDEEWLGEKWFTAFGAALGEAEKNNQYLGYCDEYWWPSFQAKGRVLEKHPELRAQSLDWEMIDVKGGSEVQVPESFFAVAAQLDQAVEPKARKAQYGKWIWHPDGTQTEHSCWFRFSFDIPDNPKTGSTSMKITADNSFDLYINGVKMGAGSDWEKPILLDHLGPLQPGKNLIAMKCTNLDGPFGLTAGILIETEGDAPVEYLTDSNWLTSLVEEKNWEKSDFHDSHWKPARILASAGQSPWNPISNKEDFTPVWIRSSTLRLIGQGAAFNWSVPDGEMWRIYVFNKFYHPGAADGQQCNSIDSRLSQAFIEIALEPYATNFGDQMGSSIPGDFIDHEGDYGWQLAWSESLDSLFSKDFKSDIRLALPLMFDFDIEGQYAKKRWQWFETVSTLYAGIFQDITNWHEQKGMYTTAHVWEEGIQPQLNCVGDHLKILRALTMPGQDCLGLKALRVHDFKEAQSVSEFENVRFASEVLGAGDFEPGMGRWGTFTPELLKKSANSFTAWGVSHVIPHGVFTTRQLDKNPWPPDWYSENPMFPWMHHWTDFVKRTSYINSMGHTVPDVLLYNPMESAWMQADAPLLDENGMWSFTVDRPNAIRINSLDQIYADAINDLTEAGIEFLVGDRYYLEQMKVKKGRLHKDPFSFQTLVLPSLDILRLDIAEKILAFARGGGKVFALGDLPKASADNGMNDPVMGRLMMELQRCAHFTSCSGSLKELLEQAPEGLQSQIRFLNGNFPLVRQHRRIDGRAFFWLANNTDQPQDCEILIRENQGAASIWDCETGTIKPLFSSENQNGCSMKLSFKPLEAYWLVLDPKLPLNPPEEPASAPQIIPVEGTWTVSYNPSVQPEMEFPFPPPTSFTIPAERALEDWRSWGLEKFSGLLDYTKVISLGSVREKVYLDLGTVNHVAEVWVNGASVGTRMWGPYVFEVGSAIQPGTNEIKIRIANLINNSYGDFKESGLRGPVRLLSY